MIPSGITSSGPVNAVPRGETVVGWTDVPAGVVVSSGGVIVVGATLVVEEVVDADVVLGGVDDVVDDVLVELVVDVELDDVLVDVLVLVVVGSVVVVTSVVVVSVVVVPVVVVGSVVVVTSVVVVVVSSSKHPWEITRFALPFPRSPTKETDAEVTSPDTTSADQDPKGGPFPLPVIWTGPIPLTVRSASVTVLLPPGVKTQWNPGVSPSSQGSLSPCPAQLTVPSANAGLGKMAQAIMSIVPAVTTMSPAAESRRPSARVPDPFISPPFIPVCHNGGHSASTRYGIVWRRIGLLHRLKGHVFG